jgi:elongation factor Ts
MSTYTAADVKRLRELTAAGMMDCKKALEEAEGDFDAAVEILRVKGAKDVGKRESRHASNGLVSAIVPENGEGVGALLELNCETDFVAKTPAFQELAATVTQIALDANISDVNTLLAHEVDGKSVQTLLDEANVVMGEKVVVGRVAIFSNGPVFVYLHKSDPALPPTLGVLVELDKNDPELARDVAQQIASMAPIFVTRDEVSDETLETERRIAETKAHEEGKPEQAVAKIVEGSVVSYYKTNVLVDQAWVRDNKQTIGQLLASKGTNVQRFARFKVGQA